MEKPQAYIGISGVGNIRQHVAVAESFAATGLHSLGRFALLGVKATTKPQMNRQVNKYGSAWYPVGEQITDAIDCSQQIGRGVLQLYSDNDWHDEKSSNDLLEVAYARTSEWLAGLQFDRLPWMEDEQKADQIMAFGRDLLMMQSRASVLILQCQGSIMSSYGNNRKKVTKRIQQLYDSGCVDYVLFDASGGTGKEMSTDDLSYWMDEVQTAIPDIGLSVAGGLDAETVQKHIPTLLARFGDISWDAEGRLHNPIPERNGNGALRISNVQAYLKASALALKTHS